MADPKAATFPLRVGELNAAVTSALVGIRNEHLGRGPTSASTFHHGNVILTLMHEVMTPAERTLAHSGNAPAVTNMRHLLQETMQSDFNAAVERLTGLRVVAFISGNHIEPDVAAEVFVIDDGRGMRAPGDSAGLGLGLPLMAHLTSDLDIRVGPGGLGTETRPWTGLPRAPSSSSPRQIAAG